MNDHINDAIFRIYALWRQIRTGEVGQGMVEYALILGFIATLVIVSLRFLQPGISSSLNGVTNNF